MAKRPADSGSNNPRPARVRYFELEGSDETIQKALATFERMHTAAIPLQPQPRRIASATKDSSQQTLFNEDGTETEAESDLEADEAPAEDENAPRRKRGEGPTVDRNAGITAPGDIDFYPSGKTSLKALFAEKQPGSDMEKCLVFCYYFQDILSIKPFGAGHVLAGFNHVGKRVPADLPATLRNMREGKKGGKAWLSVTDLDDIRVTTGGQNQVRYELGKKDSAAGDSATK